MPASAARWRVASACSTLDALRASGRLERGDDSHELRFHGWLEAELAQACVVSLEPVPASIRQPVERRYRRIDPAAAVGRARR